MRRERMRDFDGWRRALNEACWTLFGLDMDDLPDAPYWDWFADGVGPITAAKRAARRAM